MIAFIQNSDFYYILFNNLTEFFLLIEI